MTAVLICSLLSAALALGSLAMIVVGFVRARHRIAAALAYAAPVEIRSRWSLA